MTVKSLSKVCFDTFSCARISFFSLNFYLRFCETRLVHENTENVHALEEFDMNFHLNDLFIIRLRKSDGRERENFI